MQATKTSEQAAGTGERPVNCDLCGEDRGRVLFSARERQFGLPGSFLVVRCDDCGLVRTEPQPDDLGAYYPEHAYYSYRPPSPPGAFRRARIGRLYDRPIAGSPALGRLAPSVGRMAGFPPGPPGELLDVGCGSGEMLLALEEAGWRCHGVELDEQAVAAAHAAGLSRVRAGDLLEARLPERRFDAVRFWHSLEHMRSPRAQLAEAHRVCRPGGTLTIGVPNFASALSRLAGERWFYLDVPRHLWHFDGDRLARLVTESGFDVKRLRHVTSSIALVGTLDYVGRGRSLRDARWARALARPMARLVDLIRLGDGLELIAVAR